MMVMMDMVGGGARGEGGAAFVRKRRGMVKENIDGILALSGNASIYSLYCYTGIQHRDSRVLTTKLKGPRSTTNKRSK